MTLYLLKIRGTSKIPDYVQLRDEHFILMAYFKVSSPKKALKRCNLEDKMDLIMGIVNILPYGQIEKLEL